MVGHAVVIILVAMAASWLFRGLLLRILRERHPDEFAELGQPTYRQLASLFPRFQDLQIQFWKYLWGGKVFRVKDRLVSILGWAALGADVALAVGVVLLLWSAGK